ncbi:putative Glycerol-3-phosphate acyltransferase [Zalerion maritima]|uniref:Glycerol-3-phosphate acyltransferase n=1 Tax=Zalerion maritima TaxID=339359 RepID=A0AAD5S3Y3_9PEZI|nr:putative Glycerol-3-phosphate acyltransferase [Zalerion maritima]
MSSKDGDDPDGSAPDLRILGDEVSLQPSGFIEPPEGKASNKNERRLRKRDESEQELMGRVPRFRTNPFLFLRELSLYASGTGWRGYDKVIGQPVFYEGFSDHMKGMVIEHPILQKCIHEMAVQWTDRLEQEGWVAPKEGNANYEAEMKWWVNRNISCYHDKVDELLDSMICKFESKRFIRGAYYLVTQLLLRAYHQGIHVSSEEVLNLRSIAEECEKRKKSIVFLPCHKSHVDYVAMQLICYRLGIALPTVVAGDNLNFPAVGSFLQHAGAMWIQRKFDPDDRLYVQTVQAYIDTLLQNGYHFECFIEGGRSRTGKLLSPKFGILSFVLDSILSGRVEDAVVCPVSTQYDKVIETEGYVTELLGMPKKKENLVDFVSGGSSILSLRLGRVDVRFQEPWSLRKFIDDQLGRMQKMPRGLNLNLSNPAEDKQVKRRLLFTLGYKVLSDINSVSVIMPTALIGTVLLTVGGRGIGSHDLTLRVQWLVDRIRAKGGRVAHFGSAPLEDVVSRGLEVLGKDLIGAVDGIMEPTFYAVDRFQLSFYRNMTIHLFISEAIVCAALYPRTKRIVGFTPGDMAYADLFGQALFLSSLFRAEFIFPGEGLTANLYKALEGLEKDGILDLKRDGEGNIEAVTISEMEKEVELENYDFYCFLLWPFTDASWLAALSLVGLTPPIGVSSDTWIEVSKAQGTAQELGKMIYQQGNLTYIEAVNKETLKNSYQRFQEEGMIQITRAKESNQPPKLRLTPSWHCPRDEKTGELQGRGKLWDFISKISLSRREGKHRRDYATVRARILSQVDAAGRKLFEDALRTQKSTKLEVDERVESTPKYRRKMADRNPKL